jgi:hypothetical protein
MNLAISNNFGEVDLENLQFPAYMSVDYVRVYQPKDAVNTGCDPQGFPTAAYIETYVDLSYLRPLLPNPSFFSGTRKRTRITISLLGNSMGSRGRRTRNLMVECAEGVVRVDQYVAPQPLVPFLGVLGQK